MDLIIKNQIIDTNFIFNNFTLKRLIEIINEYFNNIYEDIIKFYNDTKDEKNKYVLKLKYDETFNCNIYSLTHQLSKIDILYFIKVYQIISNDETLLKLFDNSYETNILFFNSINIIIFNLLNFCYTFNKFKKEEYFYSLNKDFYNSFNFLIKNNFNIENINQYFKILISKIE